MDPRAVARELRVPGRVDSAGVRRGFSAAPDLSVAGDWRRENLHVVVFVRDRSGSECRVTSMLSLTEGVFR
jgi:hypothetical protein